MIKFPDLREWLKEIQNLGELEVIEGAHWDQEIGAICETWGSDAQALLFDRIPSYPSGFRVLTNALNSSNRIAISFGMKPCGKNELVSHLREKLKDLKLIPPVRVQDAPVLKNINVGEEIDLLKFPSPFWHELDGGRYIGTGVLTINSDPDTGWVNFGAYRAMIHDANSTGMVITRGHHGRTIMEKYWKMGKPCPMALCVGSHPLLLAMSGIEVPYGESEYDWAGGILGTPVEVVSAPFSGLPVPARGEIVLDGEVYEGDEKDEGPHGEWVGYYVTERKPRPIFRVKAVCYRDEPILLGAMPGKLPSDNTYYLSPVKSAFVWNELEQAGIPGVEGVWLHECGGGRMFLVVALKPMYGGHSVQAGMVASHCHQGAYANRITAVVDDDIPPEDLEQVIWAICTRADFRHGVTFVHQGWTSPLDPTHYPRESELDVFNSRMIIDATRPYDRRENFPKVCKVNDEYREMIMKRWSNLFKRRRSV